MKFMLRCLMIGLAAAFFAAPAMAGGNMNFFLGSRGLDKDTWSPIENQFAFGGTVDFGKKEWPIHLESGMMISVGYKHDYLPATDAAGGVFEIFFGVNKTWITKGGARPFIGGGLARLGAAYVIDGPGPRVDDHDGSGGAYLHGGVFWRLGSRFNIGVDGRILTGTSITLFGQDGNANYGQLGMILGWGWPASQ
jgi:hypothetical protein